MTYAKIQKELAKIGRKIVRVGLVIGEGGNISAKAGDIVYIKRKGAAMGCGRPADYIPVDVKTGRPLSKSKEPSTEVYMHLACYRARPGINAVVHTHPVAVTAMAIAAAKNEYLTYELEANLGSTFGHIGRMKAGTPGLGKAVGRAAKSHNAILLKDHGLVTVGSRLEEAYLRTLAAERASLVFVLSKWGQLPSSPK